MSTYSNCLNTKRMKLETNTKFEQTYVFLITIRCIIWNFTKEKFSICISFSSMKGKNTTDLYFFCCFFCPSGFQQIRLLEKFSFSFIFTLSPLLKLPWYSLDIIRPYWKGATLTHIRNILNKGFKINSFSGNWFNLFPTSWQPKYILSIKQPCNEPVALVLLASKIKKTSKLIFCINSTKYGIWIFRR